MANKATQAVTAPAQSAVGTAVEMVAGRTLVEAQASLEEIFESTSNGEKMLARGEEIVQQADALLLDWLTVWETVDGKQVKSRTARLDIEGKPVTDKDGKPVMVFVPISYPEYLQVRSWAIAKYFDCGAPTTDAAERQFERQIGRLRLLGWQSPKSKTVDAERMAKKRAEQAAKFADKSDGELAEQKAELLAKGDTKSIAQAQAIGKELDRREKPAIDAAQSQRVAIRDKLIARAKDLCKAGTADADEKLIAALQALA